MREDPLCADGCAIARGAPRGDRSLPDFREGPPEPCRPPLDFIPDMGCHDPQRVIHRCRVPGPGRPGPARRDVSFVACALSMSGESARRAAWNPVAARAREQRKHSLPRRSGAAHDGTTTPIGRTSAPMGRKRRSRVGQALRISGLRQPVRRALARGWPAPAGRAGRSGRT
jgi:hypothetical protein